MGVFDWFKKKSVAPKSAANGENASFIGKLNKLFDEKRYDEIISAVNERYRDERPPIEVKRILAPAYYYEKDYEASLKFSQEVAAELDDIASWFNVLSALMALGRPQEGREVFDKILEKNKGAKSAGAGADFIPQLSVPYLRFNYAVMLAEIDAFEDALSQVEPLEEIYSKTKITDPTFLYMRGIPPFGDYIELLKKIYNGLGTNILKSDLINRLRNSVDGEGKKIIEEQIAEE